MEASSTNWSDLESISYSMQPFNHEEEKDMVVHSRRRKKPK